MHTCHLLLRDNQIFFFIKDSVNKGNICCQASKTAVLIFVKDMLS